MDIRTKLVFALVALALGSMLALGAFMYASAGRSLATSTENGLTALAESRKLAIEDIISGWRERVQLIASRTQLRLSLKEYSEAGNGDEVARMSRILTDALGSVRTVQSITVYDTAGRVVTSVGEDVVAPTAEPPQGVQPRSSGEAEFRGTSFSADGSPQVAFSTDLVLDGEVLGELWVVLTGEELLELTSNVAGLGETGEVLIVMRDEAGIRTLHPVRQQVAGSVGPVALEDGPHPAVRALAGDEAVFREGLTDYRGEAVWAATRRIPETGWGLIVKFDDAEEERVIVQFRSEMTTLALSLSAFAILFAVLLGIRFATPIHHLSEVANRIRRGELDARATVRSEDEIGMLARTFNQMAAKLEKRMKKLHEYQRFFDYSLDMLCIAGTDGYFKRVNPAFKRTLGWSRKEMLRQPFLDLVHPDDVAATEQEIQKLSQGIPTISFENRFRCKDGSYRRLRWTSHPEPDTGLLYAVAREIPDTPTP